MIFPKALAEQLSATGGRLVTVEDHWPEGGVGEPSWFWRWRNTEEVDVRNGDRERNDVPDPAAAQLQLTKGFRIIDLLKLRAANALRIVRGRSPSLRIKIRHTDIA